MNQTHIIHVQNNIRNVSNKIIHITNMLHIKMCVLKIYLVQI